jgi:hypothetical protein
LTLATACFRSCLQTTMPDKHRAAEDQPEVHFRYRKPGFLARQSDKRKPEI